MTKPIPSASSQRAVRCGLLATLILALIVSATTPPADAQQGAAAQQAGTSASQAALGCDQVPTHFGRMFPRQAAARWPNADVDRLASRVMAEEETTPTPEGQADDEENNNIDSGFTYVGQFIDHDLTLDNEPNDLTTPRDPTTVPNLRTPKFDLDSLYGSGPTSSPQLYEADHVHLKLGSPLTGSSTDTRAVDLPRDARGQALLGDPRNDENRIVSSLHTIFLRFHNQWADRLARAHPDWSSTRVFQEAQRQVRLHYQWAVLTDFLPQVVGLDALRTVLPALLSLDLSNPVLPAIDARQTPPRLTVFNPCTTGIPVEFSVAAYRFGHSMVRPIYRINTAVADRLPVFSLTNDPTKDLGGFRPSPSNFALDWSFFFLMDGQRRIGKPQASYKLDNSLVFPLSLLPLPETGTGPASLAERNLLRSMQMGLPSGQDVARAMGVQPLRDDQILIGKATGDPADAVALSSVAPSFAGKTPLWTYVLAEATAHAYNVSNGRINGAQRAPFRLGAVGGGIVTEVFLGLMAVDRSSLLHEPTFRPDSALTTNGKFGFRELIQGVTMSKLSAPAATPTATPAPTATPRPRR